MYRVAANCNINIDELRGDDIDPVSPKSSQQANIFQSKCEPIVIADTIINKTSDRVQIVKGTSQTYSRQNTDEEIVHIDGTKFELPPVKSSQLKNYFEKLQTNFKSKIPSKVLLPLQSLKKDDPYYDDFYFCIYEYLVSFHKLLNVIVFTPYPEFSTKQKDENFQMWKQKYETEYDSTDDDTDNQRILATTKIHDHKKNDHVEDDKSIIYIDSDDESVMSHQHIENIEDHDESVVYDLTSESDTADDQAENVKDDITIIYGDDDEKQIIDVDSESNEKSSAKRRRRA